MSGGHNHAPGPKSSITQWSACYSNYQGVRFDIATSTAGQAEVLQLCAQLCSYWTIYSRYRQFGQHYLQDLPSGSNYALIGARPAHVSNHFGTQWVTSAMRWIADEYAATTNGHTIGINDISLPYGGVFDIDGTWAENNHASHRMGLSVDVQYKTDGTGYSVQDYEAFSAICAKYYGTAEVHSPGSATNQHIHINFLDVR